MSLKGETNQGIRLLGVGNEFDEVPLIVSRVAAAAGTRRPFVLVNGMQCRFGPLLDLA